MGDMKYKVGDKFIIEITDINDKSEFPYHIYGGWFCEKFFEGLKKHEPQDTAEDAWKFAENVCNISKNAREKAFDCSTLEGVFTTWTYEAAKKHYEAWKAKEEIRVGDEVISNYSDRKIIVTRVSEDEISGIFPDGSAMCGDLVDYSKTGRHFDLSPLMEFFKKDKNE